MYQFTWLAAAATLISLANGNAEDQGGVQMRTEKKPAAHRILSIALSPDERMLVTGGNDGAARMWEVATAKQVRIFRGHKNRVYTLSVSPNAKLLATCGEDATARLFDLETGEELHVFRDHQAVVYGTAFSHNGKWLATCGEDSNARIWDVATRKQVQVLHQAGTPRSLDMLQYVSFSADDKWLITSQCKPARIWDIGNGKIVREFGSAFARVSADGKWVISAAGLFHDDLQITGLCRGAKGYEDLATVKERLKINDDPRLIAFITSPEEGKWLVGRKYTVRAGGGTQGVAELVDFATLKVILSVKMPVQEGASSRVIGMVLSADRKNLFTSSSDGHARLWDVATGQMIRVFGEQPVGAPN